MLAMRGGLWNKGILILVSLVNQPFVMCQSPPLSRDWIWNWTKKSFQKKMVLFLLSSKKALFLVPLEFSYQSTLGQPSLFQSGDCRMISMCSV
jgi:hypothetical protein